jgi:hypothetical protein
MPTRNLSTLEKPPDRSALAGAVFTPRLARVSYQPFGSGEAIATALPSFENSSSRAAPLGPEDGERRARTVMRARAPVGVLGANTTRIRALA